MIIHLAFVMISSSSLLSVVQLTTRIVSYKQALTPSRIGYKNKIDLRFIER